MTTPQIHYTRTFDGYQAWDAEKASREVEGYQVVISWAACAALREIIGKMDLADILVGREKMDADLQRIIGARTAPRRVTVQPAEIRDIVIPPSLEDAMSRQAQAERERQARVIKRRGSTCPWGLMMDRLATDS